jgi:hypothetical protein
MDAATRKKNGEMRHSLLREREPEAQRLLSDDLG